MLKGALPPEHFNGRPKYVLLAALIVTAPEMTRIVIVYANEGGESSTHPASKYTMFLT